MATSIQHRSPGPSDVCDAIPTPAVSSGVDHRRRTIVAGALASLAGCASLGSQGPGGADTAALAAAGTEIPPFSRAPHGSIPPGWRPWVIHPRKARTLYSIHDVDGARVLRAQARASASGLMARLDADPTAHGRLSWRWRTEDLLHEADNSDASREDAPLRVVLAFDGDKTSLPVRDRMFFERVKLFAGVDMPYATLMYIWGNRSPLDSVIANPHTPRVQKVVACSGPGQIGRWVDIQREFVADFRRAFGEEPGRLVGVSVMSDSDNTQGDVTAYYGDITLSRSRS